MLRPGSSELHGFMWIPTIFIVLGAMFKLLASATLKREHKCQEQKTKGSTVSGQDWEGEDGQPCSKMQRERSGGTWSSRYSRYLPCSCALWFWLFDLGRHQSVATGTWLWCMWCRSVSRMKNCRKKCFLWTFFFTNISSLNSGSLPMVLLMEFTVCLYIVYTLASSL